MGRFVGILGSFSWFYVLFIQEREIKTAPSESQRMTLECNDQHVHANISDCPAADCFWQQHKMKVLMNDPEPCPAPLIGITIPPSHLQGCLGLAPGSVFNRVKH